MSAMNIADAMNSPQLFGPSFEGESWDRWRAIISATFALPMTDAEEALFREVAGGRDRPLHPVSCAVYVAGRGSGKSAIASLIAAHIASTFDPRGRLRPGEKAVVMCLAVDRAQAGIVFNYIRAYFEAIPLLAALVVEIGDEEIELVNRVVIVVATNSYRSVRGRSLLAVICDECAHWRSEDSANPDVEVVGAVRPGLARMPGSILVLISTVHKKSGVLYQNWHDCFGRDDPDTLVVVGTTPQFNRTFDRKVIEKDLASDPALYGAEYLCQWRDDLADFVDRATIEAAVDYGVTVRPPRRGIRYTCGGDPSGGVKDSFTAAISHMEGDAAVLDCLVEIRPPFSPTAAVRQVADVAKSYGCRSITGDKYAAEWVVEAFAKVDIEYAHSERDRSAIYLDTLPLFTSGRTRLLDNKRLVNQFAGLERRTSSVGKDRIDHGANGSDDLCNAAALALVLAASSKPGLTITDALLARAKQTGATDWHSGGTRGSPGGVRAFFGVGDER